MTTAMKTRGAVPGPGPVPGLVFGLAFGLALAAAGAALAQDAPGTRDVVAPAGGGDGGVPGTAAPGPAAGAFEGPMPSPLDAAARLMELTGQVPEGPLALVPEAYPGVREAVRDTVGAASRSVLETLAGMADPAVLERLPDDVESEARWQQLVDEEAQRLDFHSDLFTKILRTWKASEDVRDAAAEARVSEIRRASDLYAAVTAAQAVLHPRVVLGTIQPDSVEAPDPAGVAALVVRAEVDGVRVGAAAALAGGAPVAAVSHCPETPLAAGDSCTVELRWEGFAAGAVEVVLAGRGFRQAVVSRFRVGPVGQAGAGAAAGGDDLAARRRAARGLPSELPGDRVLPGEGAVVPGAVAGTAGAAAAELRPPFVAAAGAAGTATLVVAAGPAPVSVRDVDVAGAAGLGVRDDRCSGTTLPAGGSCAVVLGWGRPVAAGALLVEVRAGGVEQVLTAAVEGDPAALPAPPPVPWIETVRVAGLFDAGTGCPAAPAGPCPVARLAFGTGADGVVVRVRPGDGVGPGGDWYVARIDVADRAVLLVDRAGVERTLMAR